MSVWFVQCRGRFHGHGDGDLALRLGLAIERPFAHACARGGLREKCRWRVAISALAQAVGGRAVRRGTSYGEKSHFHFGVIDGNW